MKDTKEYNKSFIFPKNDNILNISKTIGTNDYSIILYSKTGEKLRNGILENAKDLSLEEILKEIFGYLDIAEVEIKTLKPYTGKLPTGRAKIVEY